MIAFMKYIRNYKSKIWTIGNHISIAVHLPVKGSQNYNDQGYDDYGKQKIEI